MLSALLLGALGAANCLPNQNSKSAAAEGDLFGFALARLGEPVRGGSVELAIGCPLVGGEKEGIGSVFILAPKTSEVVLRLNGNWPHDKFGQCIAAPGDLDGDGLVDLLIENHDPAGCWFVHAISRRSGKELHVAEVGPLRLRDFGGMRNLACLGDVTGDSVPDYAVLCGVDPDWEHPRTLVRVISGRDGTIWKEIGDKDASGAPYTELAAAGDLDGDGVQELALARWHTDAAIEIWSLKQAQPLRTISIEGASSAWRVTLAGGRDFDRDGVADLLAGLVFANPDAHSGIVGLSGKDGSQLRAWKQCASWNFARQLECIEDLNGDGVPELLVGAPESTSHDSWAGVLDGMTDRAVFEHSCAWDCSFYGVSGCGVGDVNRDGVADYVLGEASWKARGAFRGFVRLYSGKTGALLKTWSRRDLIGSRR